MATEKKTLENVTTLPPFMRSFEFDRASVKEDDRTVEVSFSSEEPYPRWYGLEILDHTPGAMNMSRLNDGAPLLWMHDPVDGMIGTVEGAKLDGRRGKATVRFSKNSDLANRVFADVKDGIVKKTSVRYTVDEIKLEKSDKETGDTYRVTKWTPLEVSMVSIPADNTVGVGRGSEAQEFPVVIDRKAADKAEHYEEVRTMATQVITPDAEAVRKKAASEAKAEGDRIGKLKELATGFKAADKLEKWITEGRSVEAAQAELLDEQKKAQAAIPAPTKIELNEKESKSYSFLRAIRAMVDKSDKEAGFEREVSDQIAKDFGRSPQANGFFVPTRMKMSGSEEVERAIREAQRTMSIVAPGDGSNLVATVLQADSFIELMRNLMTVRAAGATVLSGLVGNYDFPKQTGSGTLTWTHELPGADVAEYDLVLGKVSMTPKTAMAATSLTQQQIRQSSLDAENLVRVDIAAVNALGLDLAALYGSGVGDEPTGILKAVGLPIVELGADGAVPTDDSMIDLETKLGVANMPILSPAYITTPEIRGRLRKTPILGAGANGMRVWDRNDNVNGYRGFATNQLPKTLVKGGSGAVCHPIIFGEWRHLLIGEWGALEITVNPYSKLKQGIVEVVSFQMADIAARYVDAFAAIKDAKVS